jgi:hypothetical protein
MGADGGPFQTDFKYQLTNIQAEVLWRGITHAVRSLLIISFDDAVRRPFTFAARAPFFYGMTNKEREILAARLVEIDRRRARP